MAKIKVGINGFGRIGRLVMRSILEFQNDNIEVVGINDLTDAKTLAHLFKYDSAQGKFNGEVYADGNDLVINGNKIGVTAERDPSNLKWGERGAEVIVESTGIFRDDKGKGDIQTIVLGVNDDKIDKNETIYSNASCTTNCLAPMVKVLDEAFGVEKGFMTTIHAYTGDKFKEAAAGSLKGILEYSDEELVSTDIIGNPHSCIFDSGTIKVDGNLVKVIGWYDNEAGYSARTAELITRIL